ncbi:MAG: threonylcarbamoyl-AMP synthase [Pseudomonadales bacterium]|nr:threonylcarbamoyl-AMP synthase [Pseudomonadales bacterium]
MSQIFRIHPDNPQPRLIKQAVELIRKGGVIVYPTDSAYAIGCQIGEKSALDRIKVIRQLGDKHNFTIICRDLSELATYAIVDNSTYRLLKSYLPGPYTFLLKASKEVPKRLLHPKRKTIGLRVPDCKITQALLEELNAPLITSTLRLPGDEYPLSDPEDIRAYMEPQVDLIVDGGFGSLELTTVVDLVEGYPEILRVGMGDPADLGC